jgi:hypothetical protein
MLSTSFAQDAASDIQAFRKGFINLNHTIDPKSGS